MKRCGHFKKRVIKVLFNIMILFQFVLAKKVNIVDEERDWRGVTGIIRV